MILVIKKKLSSDIKVLTTWMLLLVLVDSLIAGAVWWVLFSKTISNRQYTPITLKQYTPSPT